jgi:hypothetical protein
VPEWNHNETRAGNRGLKKNQNKTNWGKKVKLSINALAFLGQLNR